MIWTVSVHFAQGTLTFRIVPVFGILAGISELLSAPGQDHSGQNNGGVFHMCVLINLTKDYLVLF
jgi:hypothetical protein